MAQLLIRDYERMLDIVAAVLQHDDPDSAWKLIAERLHETLDCDNLVILSGIRVDERTGHADGWAPVSLGETLADVVQRRVRQKHPLVPYLAAGEHGPVAVTQLCDSWRDSVWCSQARADCGSTYQMGLPLPDAAARGAGIVVFGSQRDFGERELAFAARIQPLLLGVHRQLRELRRLRGSAPRGPESAPSPEDFGLTPRELTVLGLLAEGLTTRAIGRRLTISPHTVNRHLEKVYRKFGTNNRVSTVSVAKRAGLVA
ncbi:helix-turn-helix transcriptional regulator [Streptomyces sp. LX-29]|uniref:helix-turn-helix transcriptional regulator n=1 Tax=Streptomyces sp. LX-29 TaxID=2900152 RepID=UPI00240DAD7F|nr:helix-turn-helix transcriptional regulator [Streptomyces sp. LX-29]WFB06006.1 helix-turn-helix transcriptional regulator [Streptomyces sp. LX-29]